MLALIDRSDCRVCRCTDIHFEVINLEIVENTMCLLAAQIGTVPENDKILLQSHI